jgi:cell division protein FtsL
MLLIIIIIIIIIIIMYRMHELYEVGANIETLPKRAEVTYINQGNHTDRMNNIGYFL